MIIFWGFDNDENRNGENNFSQNVYNCNNSHFFNTPEKKGRK